VWLIGKDEKEKDEEAFPIKGEVAWKNSTALGVWKVCGKTRVN
jgi:hypothetical protein